MGTGRGILSLAILVALSGAHGIWIVTEGRKPPEIVVPEVTGAGTGQAVELPELPAFEPSSPQRFSEALTRPLFSADRRPPADAPVATVVEDRTFSATLHGILASETGSVALLSAVGESQQLQVKQGSVFLGWTLKEIRPNSVVFERDGETVTLELDYRTQAPPVRTRR